MSKGPIKGPIKGRKRDLKADLAYGFEQALRALETIAQFNPRAAMIASLTASVVRLLRGIIDRHGANGLAEARRVLEELDRSGPQSITEHDLASDDAALDAEIEGWYQKH